MGSATKLIGPQRLKPLFFGSSNVAAEQVAEKVLWSCHSERSEESLRVQNKNLRGILRAKAALRMTLFCFFPQPVKPRPTRMICEAASSCPHRQTQNHC